MSDFCDINWCIFSYALILKEILFAWSRWFMKIKGEKHE